jgi:hypothetical protein
METDQFQNPGNYYQTGVPYKKESLPNSVAALVFGIVSLATMAYFGWIMAIIALNNAKKALKISEMNPGRYSEGSLRMANAGRIMGIIGLVMGILGVFVWILYFFLIFALVSPLSHHHYYY